MAFRYRLGIQIRNAYVHTLVELPEKYGFRAMDLYH